MPKIITSHKKLLSILIVVVVLTITIIVTYRFINKPVVVSVKSASTVQSSLNAYNIDLTPTKITDKYVSFDYPKGLSLRSTALVSPLSVDDYTFYAHDVYSWTLAIDIASAPEGQINQTSSYKFRAANPSEYLPASETFNGQTFSIFTDTTFANGFSKIAYSSDGNFVATISLTGDDISGTGPLQRTFTMLLTSWQWH